MALQEEMERAGHWLFRWRSYLPICMIGLLAAGMRDFTYPLGRVDLYRAWGLVCLGVSLLGMAVRVAAVGHAPARTSGKNTRRQVAAVMNRTGMYSVVRHPLYLGNYLITLGIAMFTLSWWVVLSVSLLFIVYYERIMYAEEAFLRSQFGEEYETWAARTPAFVPYPRLWQRPELPFSPRTVIRREYGGAFAVLASFVFMDLLAGLVTAGVARLDPMWWGLGAVSALLYIAVRALKKFTSVLDVPGR